MPARYLAGEQPAAVRICRQANAHCKPGNLGRLVNVAAVTPFFGELGDGVIAQHPA